MIEPARASFHRAPACAQIDLSENKLCGVHRATYGLKGSYTEAGIQAIADVLAVSDSLKEVALLNNNFKVETATMLASISSTKQISMCGIKPDQTKASLQGQELGPTDAILVAATIGFRSALAQVGLRRTHTHSRLCTPRFLLS